MFLLAEKAVVCLLSILLVAPLSAPLFRFEKTLPNTPPEGSPLWQLCALSVGPDSALYAADERGGRILKFSLSGETLAERSGNSPGSDRFFRPTGLVRRRGFSFYVCDSDRRRLLQLDDKLALLSVFSFETQGADPLFSPQGGCSDPSGTLYLFDATDNRIIRLDQTGRITPFPREAGRLSGRMTALAFWQGRLVMNDDRTGLLFTLDRFGNYRRPFTDSCFVPHGGMALFNDSLLCLSDVGQGRIRLVFPDNRIQYITPPDSLGPFSPGALTAGYDRIWGVDARTQRIMVFVLTPESP
ncbi:MAG: hypothetical protein A2293_00750 [Elusimicrobia bacterium RIFOXYB2_FULL_49_7]|nr:MAG: hypothetical protein A2293_00750 [Elusimicrobia bacterium RIFOXYB2_FULL_49_7]